MPSRSLVFKTWNVKGYKRDVHNVVRGFPIANEILRRTPDSTRQVILRHSGQVKEPGESLSCKPSSTRNFASVQSRVASRGRINVQDHNEEWAQLCQQAAVEKDPERLMRLVGRIVELLDARRSAAHAGSNGISSVKPGTDSGTV